MKSFITLILLSLAFFSATDAQTSSFTYQGKLADSGVAANGTYDLTFKLYDALVNGTPVGNAVVLENVVVSDGSFSVDLDFGAAAFASGASRFLQIEVRPGASIGTYTPLVPRQPLTSSPYAVKAASATSADSLSDNCILCIRDDKIDTVSAGKISGVLSYFQGGTGLGGPGPFPVAGLFLRSNGAGFELTGFTASDVPNNSVTTPKIVDASITAPKIADGAITTNGLGDGAVINQKIADESVTGNKIKTGAAGTLKWFVASADDELRPNTGVVVSATNQIRLHLPDSPSPGDVFRVVCSDTGGFRVTPNAGQFISVSKGNFANIPWAERESAREWKGLASSADGAKLAAVAANDNIYTSSDSGLTWTPRESARPWTAIASSGDGSKLVALAAGFNNPGFIYTSTDSGLSWTQRDSPRDWTAVASSADGTKLAAAVFNGLLYVSSDSGVTWAPRETQRTWRGITMSADGAKLAAVYGVSRVYTSIDSGESWTPRTIPPAFSVFSVASSADGNKLAAVGIGTILTSTDAGATWTPHTLGDFNFATATSSADGTKLATASTLPNRERIYISQDSGATWFPQDKVRDWRAIAMSGDGERVVAAGVNTALVVRGKINSTQGITGGLVGTSSDTLELVYVGGGKFLIVDLKGSITLF